MSNEDEGEDEDEDEEGRREEQVFAMFDLRMTSALRSDRASNSHYFFPLCQCRTLLI